LDNFASYSLRNIFGRSKRRAIGHLRIDFLPALPPACALVSRLQR
jgi:hypothetical protein